MWSVVTSAYAALVVYRIVARDQMPGMPTFAGFAAVTAVWAEYIAYIRPRFRWQISSIAATLATIISNAVVAFNAVMADRHVPIARLFFTLLFALVLRDRLHELITYR